LPPIAPELLILPPLAVAAGIDLYLTLLLIGAAPTLGLWSLPLPGALGDLDSPSVLITVGVFYLLEFAAERFPPAALAWNAFHAIIRPVSGALLALLLLDGQPLLVALAGALIGAALASVAHGMRLGAGVAPSILLVSLAEDVLVAGLVSLSLDVSPTALAATLVAWILLLGETPSLLRAFAFAVWLAVGHVFRPLRPRRWTGVDDMPLWVVRALEDDDLFAPGGALRGTRAAAWRLQGRRRFLVGWVVVRGGAPLFVSRRRGSAAFIDLGAFEVEALLDEGLYRRIDLISDGPAPFLLFGSDGPSTEGLRAEFSVPDHVG
ncbi:MAG: DUF4126 domain-containing protein, partial [Longimicrobiales bacterium]